MPPKKLPTIWEAEPHTIAKIAILEGYLQAWFPIFGRGPSGQPLLYVDGFAGPGRYTNHSTGSPIAALRSASKALSAAGSAWTSGDVHCAFIEEDRARFEHLSQHVEPFQGFPKLYIHLIHSTFVDGIAQLRRQMASAFSSGAPLFVFIDPFGATGAPFTTVASLLRSPRSEVLINFDADTVARILRAGARAAHEPLLNDIFGNDTWKALPTSSTDFPQLCRAMLNLYKARLRSLPGVRYSFAFEMNKSGQALHYFLVFASQHRRGLEKMKDSMKRIDQTGGYRFSDAHVGKTTLFRFDTPGDFAPRVLQHFSGQEATYDEIWDFALNETPFTNPKSMLKNLEQQSQITVFSRDPKRRKGTFKEEAISLIVFRDVLTDG